MIDIGLATMSAIVAGSVLAIYLKNWRSVRTSLLFGLVLFGAILLASNVGAAVVYFRLAQTYAADVAVPLLAIQAAQLAGLLGLLWATAH